MTRSKTSLLVKMLYVNQSLCQKPMQSNRDHQMDNKSFSEDTRTGTNENSPCSEVANKMYEDTAVPEEGHDTGMSTRNQGECSGVNTEERERQTRELGSTPMGPGFHVSYKLWKLSKDEGHTDDWKEGFLKGDQNNREIKVLVRCKVDGCEIHGNKIQRFCIVPKMEYQTEYDVLCLARSELTWQWISLYVRPGADLHRVHVNACTSEVMMIE
jgi:hypothetical protein